MIPTDGIPSPSGTTDWMYAADEVAAWNIVVRFSWGSAIVECCLR